MMSDYFWRCCKGPRLVFSNSEIDKRLQKIWEEQQEKIEKEIEEQLWMNEEALDD